jgi:molybdopterin-binding protein
MPTFRIKQPASLLGVSTDTLRRWADAGRLETTTDAAGRLAVDGAALARLAQDLATADPGGATAVVAHSMRNRFTGLVTRVVRDTVMAQVEIQAGPHRFVSLLSREAADELGLEPGCSRSPPSRPPASPSRSRRADRHGRENRQRKTIWMG